MGRSDAGGLHKDSCVVVLLVFTVWVALLGTVVWWAVIVGRHAFHSSPPSPPAAVSVVPSVMTDLPPPAHPARPAVLPAAVAAAPSWQYDVVDKIANEAARIGLPPRMLLALALQEGGLAPPYPVGDLAIGGSCGPWQNYLPVWGGPCERWYDPLAGMAVMRVRWLRTYYARDGFVRWESCPPCLLAAWAGPAQGSDPWSTELAALRLAQADEVLVGYQEQRARRAMDGLTGPPKWLLLGLAAEGLEDLSLRAAVQAEQLRREAGR